LVDHGDASFPALRQNLAELAAQVLDLLVALVLFPAMLLVEEGLPALVLGEVQGLDRRVGEFERTVVGAAKEAHDAVDTAKLLGVQPGQIDEGMSDQERETDNLVRPVMLQRFSSV
jgi:hypothetical protein